MYGGDTSPREDYATLTWNNPVDETIVKYQYRHWHLDHGICIDSGGNRFNIQGNCIDNEEARKNNRIDEKGYRIDENEDIAATAPVS